MTTLLPGANTLVDPVSDPVTVEVEVGVLGPLEVRGAARPFERAWSLDLVVYLAMHERGATNDAWATALWPDRLMAAATVHTTVSAARRSLGLTASGEDHLPRHRGGLRLRPTVSTDWRRLRSLSARPGPAAWWAGLELVRGRPFEGLRSPDWVVLEGVGATVEDGVVALATKLAQHHLARGEGRLAALAARRGLLASPFDERLYRLLLRSADAEGHPSGVERVMAELVQLVGGPRADARPVGALGPFEYQLVHPETVDLYLALSRRRGAPGAIGSRQ